MGDSNERGVVLPLMAIMLVILVGVTAMAVDLGWLYWQSIEIQHGADAAALAGVVYEPDRRTEAKSEALSSARENGFDDGLPGTMVTVIDFIDDDTAVANDSMLRVTVRHGVETFFMKIFGLNQVNIQKTAVAEYIQPLRMGSPESYFGDDPALGIYPGFSPSINGPYVAKAGGDRFGSLCLSTGFAADCEQPHNGAPRGLNPEGRVSTGWGTTAAQGGYLYGIDVPVGSSGLNVEIFNGPMYAIRKNKSSPLPSTGSGNFLGDGKSDPGTENVEGRTWFMLYGPDPTPGDSTDGNELLCSVAYEERESSAGGDKPPRSDAYAVDFGAMGWDDSWLEFDQVPQAILNAMWDNMSSPFVAGHRPGDVVTGNCSQASFDRGPGTYLLRVFNEHNPSESNNDRNSWRLSNRYSLRVRTSSGAQPTISAIGDMSIGAARNTTQTSFHLAKVEERYAGRTLVLELWDVGDIDPDGPNGDHFLIRDDADNTVDCTWVATDTSPDPISKPNPTSGGPGPCKIEAYDRIFNDELITISVELAEDYTCSNDCWWTIKYNYAGGTVKDTTTWSAFIAGNPIRLVE